MARLIVPKPDSELERLNLREARAECQKMADCLNRIINEEVLFCHKCGSFYAVDAFYMDKRFSTERFPICKRCLIRMACDYDKKTDTYIDNKEKTIDVLRLLDLPYIDSLYCKMITNVKNNLSGSNKNTAYIAYLSSVKHLDQYNRKTFKDSEFGNDGLGDEIANLSKRKPRKEIVKIFGVGYSSEEYLYLQDLYDDWCSRTQVDSKSQQTYVTQICLCLLEIHEDRRAGKDVTKKLETLDKLMNSANLQPKQNVSNASTDSLTFGQLIERWEAEEPIPEPDPELADVDSIGKNLRVWFGGWLAHALGLNVPLSKEYEEEVAKYTVEKPSETESNTSSALYKELFGSDVNE